MPDKDPFCSKPATQQRRRDTTCGHAGINVPGLATAFLPGPQALTQPFSPCVFQSGKKPRENGSRPETARKNASKSLSVISQREHLLCFQFHSLCSREL